MFIKLTPRAPVQTVPAGTEADPTGFTDHMVVAGTTGTTTANPPDGSYTIWYAVKLLSGVAYTMTQNATGDYWEMESAAMYLYDGTPTIVAQSVFDWETSTGGTSITYTPSATGVYLLKVMGGGATLTHSTAVTPVPETYNLEYTTRYTSAGFDKFGRFLKYSSSVAAALKPPATSYTNPGGSGNRSSTITVSATGGWDRGTTGLLVDGTMGLVGLYPKAAAGCGIIFDFKAPRVITAATFYTYAGFSYGYWTMQGAPSASGPWSGDLCSPVQIVGGGESTGTVFTLNNAGAYRYYRFLGTSGNIEDGYFMEVNFKIDAGT